MTKHSHHSLFDDPEEPLKEVALVSGATAHIGQFTYKPGVIRVGLAPLGIRFLNDPNTPTCWVPIHVRSQFALIKALENGFAPDWVMAAYWEYLYRRTWKLVHQAVRSVDNATAEKGPS